MTETDENQGGGQDEDHDKIQWDKEAYNPKPIRIVNNERFTFPIHFCRESGGWCKSHSIEECNAREHRMVGISNDHVFIMLNGLRNGLKALIEEDVERAKKIITEAYETAVRSPAKSTL